MESVEAATGLFAFKTTDQRHFFKGSVLCCGCSSQHTRKVTGRDNSALGSSVVKLPDCAGQGLLQPAARLALGLGERRSPPLCRKGWGRRQGCYSSSTCAQTQTLLT